MTRALATLALLFAATAAQAAAEDDPLLVKLMFDELELRRTHGDAEFGWEIEAWIGKDLNKLWLKSEGERDDGHTDESEFQLLYSRAVSPYWNAHVGWRGDARPSRDWLVVGVQGLAPYFIDVDANLFVGGSGETGIRLEAEREFLITQTWILAPTIELNAFTDDDTPAARGSGLSSLEASVQMRYLLRRNFAPYAALRWEQTFGDTRGLLRDRGEATSEIYFVVGLTGWF